MEKDEIKEYRKILEKEFSDKDMEIESSLSYISIGALGFFITINKDFFKLQEASCKWLLIASLIFIFFSFVLILFRKSRTSHHDFQMMTFIDRMSENSSEEDQELLSLWDKSHKELDLIRIFIYISLLLGIALQIIFLMFNI